MARELHVIVHECCVDDQAVKDEIESIKKTKEYLAIEDWPQLLHSKMPPPSPDLNVVVSGAYKDSCCMIHLYELRKTGYKARLHETACFHKEGVVSFWNPPEDAREVVPEFFEKR